MSETNIQTQAPQPLSAILRRVANPLLLFSGTLCFLLLLSWLFVLPKFTSVQRPDGVAMAPKAIAVYTQQLAADVRAAEDHRSTLIRAVHDDAYYALITARSSASHPLLIEEAMRQAAARTGEKVDSIVFSIIAINESGVTVEGDVRNVGPRSMTVLAAFSDAVAALPFVTALQRPPFSRETLPDGSMHSPFRFSFTLSHP